eukprot:5650099-Pyramimonas_sp.AAC.1
MLIARCTAKCTYLSHLGHIGHAPHPACLQANSCHRRAGVIPIHAPLPLRLFAHAPPVSPLRANSKTPAANHCRAPSWDSRFPLRGSWGLGLLGVGRPWGPWAF